MKKLILNLRISVKLLLGFLLITLLCVSNGLVGIYNLKTVTKNEQLLYDKNTSGAIEISDAQREFLKTRIDIRNIIIYSKSDKTQYYGNIESSFRDINEKLESYSKKISDSREKTIFNELKASFSESEKAISSIVQASKSGKPEDELLRMFTDAGQTASKTDAAFKNLSDYNAALSRDRVKMDVDASNKAAYILLGLIAASFLIGIILTVANSRILSAPIKKFSALAQMLAAGDTDANKIMDEKDLRMKKRKDEIGILANSFSKLLSSTNEQARTIQKLSEGDLTAKATIRSDEDVVGKSLSKLIDTLNALLTDITFTAEQVAAGSEVVSNSSMALSQGATEQASSVEELTVSLEEISSQTGVNAQNAQSSNELSKKVKMNAENGSARMSEMLRAMNDISQASSSIKKIIKNIDDIAFQTNILALNAAVEAARAGQHGKGFAVVADEVRNLASRAARAASETTELIEGSIVKVETGTKIADDTAAVLGAMVEEVAKVAEQIEAIAVASREQASAIEQINQGINQVSQVVSNNAAISEETAAASEQLSSHAAQLQEKLKVFKINSNGEQEKNSASVTPAPRSDNSAGVTKNLSKPNNAKKEINFGKY